MLFWCGCSLALGCFWGRGSCHSQLIFPLPGSQSLALIPPFSKFCYQVPRVHPGLLSLGEAGGSSRQLGDRPCFLGKTRRRQRICWVFFPSLPHVCVVCALPFGGCWDSWVSCGGAVLGTSAGPHMSQHSTCLVRCSRYSWNYRVMEEFGLEGALKLVSSHPVPWAGTVSTRAG